MTPTLSPGIRALNKGFAKFLKGQPQPLARLLKREAKIHDWGAMLGERYITYVGPWAHWQFVTAAADSDVRLLKRLIAAGLHRHACSDRGEAALSVVARHDWAAGVRLLAAAGVSLDERDSSGCAPLHLAAYEGASKAVKALLEAGASRDLVTGDAQRNTALHVAAIGVDQVRALEVIEVLLAAGLDTQACNGRGATARAGAASCLRRHTVNGFDELVAKRDRGEILPLTISPPVVALDPSVMRLTKAFVHSVRAIRACIAVAEEAGERAANISSKAITPLPGWAINIARVAIKERDRATMRRILSSGLAEYARDPVTGDGLLHLLAAADWAEMIRPAMYAGTFPNIPNLANRTPLHDAVRARAVGSLEVMISEDRASVWGLPEQSPPLAAELDDRATPADDRVRELINVQPE